MVVDPNALSIHDFLLAYILGEVDELDAPVVAGADRTGSGSARQRLAEAGLRAEMGRHEAWSTTVVSRAGVETVARCKVCSVADGWPCTALRVLALPYARHPAYRSEWQVPGADALVVSAQDAVDREH